MLIPVLVIALIALFLMMSVPATIMVPPMPEYQASGKRQGDGREDK
jgi:hypothetical protein